jgi:hypothetical protein
VGLVECQWPGSFPPRDKAAAPSTCSVFQPPPARSRWPESHRNLLAPAIANGQRRFSYTWPRCLPDPLHSQAEGCRRFSRALFLHVATSCPAIAVEWGRYLLGAHMASRLRATAAMAFHVLSPAAVPIIARLRRLADACPGTHPAAVLNRAPRPGSGCLVVFSLSLTLRAEKVGLTAVLVSSVY